MRHTEHTGSGVYFTLETLIITLHAFIKLQQFPLSNSPGLQALASKLDSSYPDVLRAESVCLQTHTHTQTDSDGTQCNVHPGHEHEVKYTVS